MAYRDRSRSRSPRRRSPSPYRERRRSPSPYGRGGGYYDRGGYGSYDRGAYGYDRGYDDRAYGYGGGGGGGYGAYGSGSHDSGRGARRSPPRPAPVMTEQQIRESRCLFVGNLPFTMIQRDLDDLFSRCGRCVVTMGMERRTGRPKGFAFVEYETREDAEEAHRHFNGRDVEGRRLRVDWDPGLSAKGQRPPPTRRSPSPRRRSPSPRRRSPSPRRRSPSPRRRSPSPRRRSPSPVRRSRSRSPRDDHDHDHHHDRKRSLSPRHSHSRSRSPDEKRVRGEDDRSGV